MSQKAGSFLKRQKQETYLIIAAVVLLVIVCFLVTRIVKELSSGEVEISSQTVTTSAPSLQLSSIGRISNDKPNVQMIISDKGTIEVSGTVSDNGVRNDLLKSLQSSFIDKATSQVTINPKSDRAPWEDGIPDLILYAQTLSDAQIILEDSTVTIEGRDIEEDPQLEPLKQTFSEPQFSEITLTIRNATS